MRKFLLFWSVLLLGSIGVKGQELFAPEQIISSSFINESARYIHATDINGDNHLDILATFKGEVVWYENNGNTQFGNPVQVTNSIVETNSEIAYGSDIDGDGDMDVLTASLGGVQWYKNDNGLGDFGIQNSIIGVKNISDVACVDLDSDGDFDVIVKGEEVIVWCKNDGKGNFEEFLEIENASTSESFRKGLYVSDLDKDGDVDFIASLDESIGWYENDGQGNFTKKVISTNDGNIKAIYGSDVDNDGDIDIFCGFSHPTLFVWYENDGVANFNEEHFISSSSTNSNYSNSLYSTDLDNDNDMDVVSALGFSNKLVWYENGGYGNFSGENIISIDTEKIVFVCGYDIDKDGDMDVFSVSYKDSKIAWYENILDETEIRMLAFQDLNENGIYEDSEPLFPNQQILLNPTNNTIFSSIEGYTYFSVKNGEYELFSESNTLWELTTPETYNITITDNSEVSTYYFGFKPTRILPRVEPLLSSSITRCNREATYWLNYSNTGTTTGKGIITLESDELMQFISSNPEPDVIEGRKLTWNITDLYPSFENKIQLQFQMPDFNSIGEILETQASIELFNDNQELVYSKSTQYDSEVRCSYDPNDKLARSNILGQSEFAYLGDTILYTVRFQNTGNDTAFNIRIEDVLDKKLDLTTFHPITASHDYRTELNRETGLATFYFDDILLPDSTTNEVESHGFVTFAVASLANLSDKIEVDNTASIFFDFNPAIVTNTAVLTLIEQVETDIEDLDMGYSILIRPNPFSDYTTIEVEGLPKGDYRLEVMDILGRKARELKSENGEFRVERGDLESGIYFFRVLSSGGEFVGSGKVLVE